ncbi:hypothetical protein GCM10011399_05670 [Subtercola lobariae]|uniref:Uncharacterized protein n=1 Tax=Subtercola lobariae TaxID=1588641 RepID=A0A917EUQ6_9MICO|nr:hypothetical protein GCM10011399_05670 [Subtercola lobariae]
MRMSPTCGVPVGDGQNLTRTSAPVAVEKGGSSEDDILPAIVRAAAEPSVAECADRAGVHDKDSGVSPFWGACLR